MESYIIISKENIQAKLQKEINTLPITRFSQITDSRYTVEFSGGFYCFVDCDDDICHDYEKGEVPIEGTDVHFAVISFHYSQYAVKIISLFAKTETYIDDDHDHIYPVQEFLQFAAADSVNESQ